VCKKKKAYKSKRSEEGSGHSSRMLDTPTMKNNQLVSTINLCLGMPSLCNQFQYYRLFSNSIYSQTAKEWWSSWLVILFSLIIAVFHVTKKFV
jgi:hypothetical protein